MVVFCKLVDYLDWASNLFEDNNLFFGHGTDNPWDEAVLIAIHVLNLPIDMDKSYLNYPIEQKNSAKLEELTRLRVETKIPLPYLLGYVWYAGGKYIVNTHTLIPRSPIFSLIDDGFKTWQNKQPTKILDLCTGSGVLALVAAKKYPKAKVIGSDISEEALSVARQNKQLHNASNVEFIHSNLYENLSMHKNSFDLIITNPPYVAEKEYNDLPDEYLHEPKLALTAKSNGMELVLLILKYALDYLTDEGILILEVGYSWTILKKKITTLNRFKVKPKCGGLGIFIFTKHDLEEINAKYL